VSAAASAASAASSYDQFDDRYLGSKTSNPTVDNDGNALVVGALYYNSVAGKMRVYDGAQWIDASASSQAILVVYQYTATGGQTTFSGTDNNSLTLGYTVGSALVTLNGVMLEVGSEVTASSGTSVVLASGATAGDELNVYAFSTFNLADVYTKAQTDARYVELAGDTMTGQLILQKAGGSAGSSNNLYVNVTSSFGGISVNSTANNNTFVELLEAGTKVGGFNADTTNNVTSIQSDGGHALGFNTGGTTERMRIDTSGRVTMPYQPAFRAYYSSTSTRIGGGNTTVPFDTAELNVGGHYNTSTGRFTAPVAGVYQINLVTQHDGNIGDAGWIDIRKNGAETRVRYEEALTGTSYNAGGISTTIYLNVGDYITAHASTTAVWWSHHTCLSGFLVG
jgi:hypothetical protein